MILYHTAQDERCQISAAIEPKRVKVFDGGKNQVSLRTEAAGLYRRAMMALLQ